LTLTISETTQDRAIVTIEHQQEVIGSLSNGDIFNDLHGPLTRFSMSWHFWSRISQTVRLTVFLVYDSNGKPYIIYQMVPRPLKW